MLFRAQNLQRHIGERLLWQGLTFDLQPEQRLAVPGPSGTGKSVLLRTLAGLEPLEAGEVLFHGKPQQAYAMPKYRAAVMYLPQRAVLAGETVEEVLCLPFRLQVHAGREYSAGEAAALLESVGRGPEFLELDAATLSGGEAQIAALVRALLLRPSVLLLDEATSALDAGSIAGAEALLLRWAAGGDRALIFISHDPAQGERLGTHFLPIGTPAATEVAP